MAFAHFSQQPEWAMDNVREERVREALTNTMRRSKSSSRLRPSLQCTISPLIFVSWPSTLKRSRCVCINEHASSSALQDLLNGVCLNSLGKLDWVLNFVKPVCNLPEKKVLDACESLLFFFLGSQQKAFVNAVCIRLRMHA